MPIIAEQIKEYSLTNLQISLNAAIAQNKIANQINDPTGWISKGTLHIVENVPAWNGTQEGLLYYINSTDELFIGTGVEPYYALITNNGITAGFDSSIETLMGSEGNNWNGSIATRFSSENEFSIDGSNLFIYLNGMLLHRGATEDYIIINGTTIELNSAISGTDKITFLVYKSVLLTNYATKAYVEGKLGSLTTDIIPATSTIDIGSTTNPIDHIYANEVFLSASSLYVNGKKVVEDASNIMTFTTEIDSSIDVKTTGIGNLSLRSDSQVNVVSKGGMEYSVPADIPSKNINFTNLSSNGQIVFSSAAPVVVSNDLSVGGNLIVNGTTTTVNSTTLLIQDNIITLNKGQTGTPLSTLVSGIEIERGDENNYRFIFAESDQTFRVGINGAAQAVATRQDAPTNNAVPIWNDTAKRFDTTSVTISGSTITGSLSGNATSATTAGSCTGNAETATTATTANGIRTSAPETLYNGDIWIE